jgi:hypothetical protein
MAKTTEQATSSSLTMKDNGPERMGVRAGKSG